MKQKIIQAILFLNIGLSIATLLSYLAAYIDPRNSWPFIFLASSYFYLLLANISLIIFWLFIKRKNTWVSILTLLIGINHINSSIGFHFTEVAKQESTYTIMSLNTGGLNLYRGGKVRTKKRLDILMDFLHEKDVADILCFQEFGNYSYFAKKMNLKNLSNLDGACIYTKHPILEKGKINFNKSSNSAVWADVQLPEKTVRVYSIHLQSNKVTHAANKIAQKNTLKNPKKLKGVKGILGRVRKASRIRVSQAQLISDHMKKSPHPIIVCGDFNDTPQSYTYKMIANGLQNSFKQKGKGLGITYAGSIPGLHIDHILLDKEIVVEKHQITKKTPSDHYAVYSDISF